jgi:acetyl esterase/lipase
MIDVHQWAAIRRPHFSEGLGINAIVKRTRIAVGSEDGIRMRVPDLRDALQDAGIPVRYDEVPGAAHEIPPAFGPD